MEKFSFFFIQSHWLICTFSEHNFLTLTSSDYVASSAKRWWCFLNLTPKHASNDNIFASTWSCHLLFSVVYQSLMAHCGTSESSRKEWNTQEKLKFEQIFSSSPWAHTRALHSKIELTKCNKDVNTRFQQITLLSLKLCSICWSLLREFEHGGLMNVSSFRTTKVVWRWMELEPFLARSAR